ncbi:hypothetical protein WMY93_016552 [Mugilogobius chulae]|uniref:Uncharacterized protein n=1 Tax=Mugilogobius chulae TaxID=88201 RepID=A0AAW0NKL6_9GOBI
MGEEYFASADDFVRELIVESRLTHLSVCNVRLPWPVGVNQSRDALTNPALAAVPPTCRGPRGSTIRPVPCYAFHALLQEAHPPAAPVLGHERRTARPPGGELLQPAAPEQAEGD